ncbi:MAG TPA: ABC transporter substrate-binding protein [Chloroflexota bacterium]|nr:ABC transporter substrate-binding protein [Chloroflexota bacterium]
MGQRAPSGRGSGGVARRLAPPLLAIAVLGCASRGLQPQADRAVLSPPPAMADNPAAASSQPSASTHLTIAYTTASSANSVLLLAQQQGLFQANGLEVETVYAPGNGAPAALVSGQAQAISSGCAEALGPIASGADFVYVLVNTNRLQYVLAGGPTLQSREDLRGKRLAVSRLGTSSHLATKFILKYLGLDPERDATYIQVGNTPERVTALLNGSVDGSILSVEEGVLLGEIPGMRLIVDMTQEKLPYCGNGLVLPRQTLAERAEVVRRLVRALVEAIARYKQDREAGMAAVSRFLDESDPVKVERIWTVRSALFPAKPYPESQGLQFVIDEAAQFDPRIAALVPERLADPRWVRELDESGYIDRLYPQGAPP